MKSLLEMLFPECIIEKAVLDKETIMIQAHRRGKDSSCPECRQRSDRVHSYYTRKPQDLPMSGYYVRLNLITRRFRCRNRDCQRQTFAERWGEWLHPYAHKTSRAKDVLYRVAQVAGGQGGQRLLRHLKMMASGATLIRLLREQTLPKIQTTRVLGVDDWAICRGRTYGTILVDLEKGEVVELLPDRQAETLAEWLRTHPNVQIIARDRSTEYAHGIDLGAPHVQQVADR